MGTEKSRVRSLDGLRGIAALVVLVHHALLTVPALAMAYYPASRSGEHSGLLKAFTYTPLHLIWAGTEAVYVFFILSGVVLALPVINSRSFDWINYYPRRLIRLYVPVSAAVALAALTIFFIPRISDASLGAWINARPTHYTPGGVTRDVALVGGVSRTVSPLWSLQWEVLFSLTLPLYIYLALKWRNLTAVKLALVFFVVVAGAVTSNPYLTFLPMFAIGVLIASNWDKLEMWSERINNHAVRWWIWSSILALTGLLLSSFWILAGLNVPSWASKLTLPMIVIGAGLAVLCCGFCSPVKSGLLVSPVQWLGRISFSLYLIHEPIVIGTRFLFPDAPVMITILASVFFALLAAQIFFRFIEMPSHRLARSLGLRISRTIMRDAPDGRIGEAERRST